jgi:uncharacterized protein YggU (UPF0235/DUF167 family)
VTPAPHWRWEGERLHLSVQGKPGARRDAFGRATAGRLQVQIACVAEDGRATERLLAFLAGEFGVPRRAVTLVYGRTSQRKAVCIEAPTRLPPQAGITLRPRSS